MGAVDLNYRLGLMCPTGNTLVSPGERIVFKTFAIQAAKASISSVTRFNAKDTKTGKICVLSFLETPIPTTLLKVTKC